LATTDTRPGWVSPSLRKDGVEGGFAADLRMTQHTDDPYEDAFPDEPRWPAWKVTVVVVVFCTACWAGIGYLAVRLLG
jgi:hypothetical protein